MIFDRLQGHVRSREKELLSEKRQGRKVVGYLPGNFVPEEIIWAAGAAPVCLSEGSFHMAEMALSKVPNVLCPFARAQITEISLKANPFYALVDVVVVPISCQHLKKVAEVLEYEGGVKVMKLGVPHQDGDLERGYFVRRLKDLAYRLETVTGRKVTRQRLKDAVAFYDRIRGLLREVSFLRRVGSSLRSAEFIRLNHLSFYADPVFFVEELERIREALRQEGSREGVERPRVLLMGPVLASGDYWLLDLIDGAGGEVAMEEFFEGVRYYLHEVGEVSDPFEDLARFYLSVRLPAAFMRASARRRLETIESLVEEFRVQGVIFYRLLCCETYDQESYFLSRQLGNRGLPFLSLESDFSPAAQAQAKVRIEAFLEMLKGT